MSIEKILQDKIREENRNRKISYILSNEPFIAYTKDMALNDTVEDFMKEFNLGRGLIKLYEEKRHSK